MLGYIRNRDCISYPGVGTFVLIRPAQTFYERIKLSLAKGGALAFQIRSATIRGEEIHSIVVPKPETWTHVAGTWDGATMTIYVDGTPGESSLGQQGKLTSETAPAGFGDPSMNGLIDEVRIYSRALSPGEIKAVYDSESAGIQVAPAAPGPVVVVEPVQPAPAAPAAPAPVAVVEPVVMEVQKAPPPGEWVHGLSRVAGGYVPPKRVQGEFYTYQYPESAPRPMSWQGNPLFADLASKGLPWYTPDPTLKGVEIDPFKTLPFEDRVPIEAHRLVLDVYDEIGVYGGT